ncbi:MAG: heavy metal RND transporter [Hyphomicrobium sp. 32-62-53]|nr:MAG: heavy metal RND transporter [Hyphomicrobium sp. 12-62-95]OYX98870.1 MAG: heavy metal RND transporter [Hyphomicrobium sp. 32-62-53]
MKHRNFLLAALAGLVMITAFENAFAGAADYSFEPISVDIKNGAASELGVRLVHKPSGKPVEGAVLFRTRLDMAPDGMADMEAQHAAMPSEEPGVYRFKADLTMAGGWAFRMMAKVPGEKDTIEGVVIFQAKD